MGEAAVSAGVKGRSSYSAGVDKPVIIMGRQLR